MRDVRQQILREHRDTAAAVVDTGRAVAETVDGWPVTDAEHIRRPLNAHLRERELLDPLLGVLGTGAGVLETGIRGTPVTAPPYLVVTSRGPLCRATLDCGRRLVVEFALFAVERRPRRYRFRDPDAEGCLRVTLR